MESGTWSCGVCSEVQVRGVMSESGTWSCGVCSEYR